MNSQILIAGGGALFGLMLILALLVRRSWGFAAGVLASWLLAGPWFLTKFDLATSGYTRVVIELGHQLFDRLRVATHDDLGRTVEVRRHADAGAHLGTELLGRLAAQSDQGGHRPRSLSTGGVHQLAAESHGPQRVLE